MRARCTFMPRLYRMPPGQEVDSRQTDPGKLVRFRFRHHLGSNFDTSLVVRLRSSPYITPDRVIAPPFRSTLTTKALNLSSLSWFETCLYQPIPRDLPSSLMQHGYFMPEAPFVTHYQVSMYA